MDDTQEVESASFAELVAEVPVKPKCPGEAVDGRRIVTGQAVHGPQKGEGAGFAELVAEVPVKPKCLGEVVDSGRMLIGDDVHFAQIGKCPGMAEGITGEACRFNGDAEEGEGLIPVAAE